MAGATSPASSIFFPPRIVAEMRPSQRGFGPRLDRGPSATALGGCHRPPWAMSALREGVSAASQSAYSAACTRPRHLGSLGCTGSTGTGTGSVLYRVPVLYYESQHRTGHTRGKGPGKNTADENLTRSNQHRTLRRGRQSLTHAAKPSQRPATATTSASFPSVARALRSATSSSPSTSRSCSSDMSTPGWSVMSGEDPERRTDVGSSQTPELVPSRDQSCVRVEQASNSRLRLFR